MIALRISSIIKHATITSYENGCDFDHCVGSLPQVLISTPDMAEEEAQKHIIDQAACFIGANPSEVIYYEEEPDRFDLQVLECEEGSPASELEIELWKEGKEKLYHCDYSFYVERITPFELKQN